MDDFGLLIDSGILDLATAAPAPNHQSSNQSRNQQSEITNE
jgi:hypothetical protein